MKIIFSWFNIHILKRSDRSNMVKKNIFFLTILKFISVCSSLILVPLTLRYLEPNKYGIWLTLSSIVAWVGYFDLGLSNGMRNKLGEAFANNDLKTARVLVSTTFASLLIMVIFLNIFFWIINPFLNWNSILNVNVSMKNEINLLVFVVFTLFSFQFLTGLIIAVINSDQQPALANSINVFSSLLSLIVIYLLTLMTKNSLLFLGISLSAVSFIVPLTASICFFKFKYNNISPSFAYVDFRKITSIAKQGVQFFILQITTIILTMTDLLIISRLYGSKEVVPYNIAYRLFGYVIIVFGIFTTPLWASYNEAYNKNDYSWIKRVTNKMVFLWVILVSGVFCLIAFSNFIYKFWIGNQIVIPISLTFYMGVFVILQSLNSIFATFIYSTGKLLILTYTAIFISIINIPLCLLLSKYFNFGTSGIIIATILCTSLNLIIVIYQYNKIINNKATGIWIK